MSFDDIRVVVLQNEVHLFDFFGGHGFDGVDVIMRGVKFGTATFPYG